MIIDVRVRPPVKSFLNLRIFTQMGTFAAWVGQTLPQYMEVAPWLVVFPSLAVSLAVFGFNLLGDALRDVLDQRLKGGKPCGGGWSRRPRLGRANGENIASLPSMGEVHAPLFLRERVGVREQKRENDADHIRHIPLRRAVYRGCQGV